MARKSRRSGTRDLAFELKAELERSGLRVQIIGERGDCAVLHHRTRDARGADLFVSIHHDSVTLMKTTIELPDELLIAAKKRAAELRCTLRTLTERALRHELSGRRGEGKARKRAIRWVTVRGGLPRGLDIRDRAAMHDWLRRQA